MPTNYCFGKAGKKQNQVAKNITSKNHAILLTAGKVSKYGDFSGLYFSTFRLNAERYGVCLRIQSECEKIRTRKIPYLGTFHAVHESSLNLVMDTQKQLFL